MAKSSLLDEIDSAVAVRAQSKRTTWFDTLPPDAKAVLNAARDKFRNGEYSIARLSLAKVLVAHATKHGWKICDARRMSEWLASN